jgi:hypothetical protein
MDALSAHQHGHARDARITQRSRAATELPELTLERAGLLAPMVQCRGDRPELAQDVPFLRRER